MALGDVACVGNETRLIDCQSAAMPSCSHSDDAGVLCKTECKMKCSLTYYTLFYTGCMQ